MNELKSDKITIFKEVFDYYYDGDLTKEQLADLLLLHYETKWGDGVDVNSIDDKEVKVIWKTLRHTVVKSVKNAKEYENRKNNKNKAVTNDNTSSGTSNITTKENSSESLKMTNRMDIPSEFAIPTPEVNEPVVDEGEIDDTGEFYYEWESECERLIKDAMIDTLEGNGYAMRECNNKLQEIYNVCVANGCSEVLLSQIKDSVKERVSNEVEKEYNEKVA